MEISLLVMLSTTQSVLYNVFYDSGGSFVKSEKMTQMTSLDSFHFGLGDDTFITETCIAKWGCEVRAYAWVYTSKGRSNERHH